jgi:hypothetical protein
LIPDFVVCYVSSSGSVARAMKFSVQIELQRI